MTWHINLGVGNHLCICGSDLFGNKNSLYQCGAQFYKTLSVPQLESIIKVVVIKYFCQSDFSGG